MPFLTLFVARITIFYFTNVNFFLILYVFDFCANDIKVYESFLKTMTRYISECELLYIYCKLG